MKELRKPFTVSILREITDQVDRGDISYGKMVEILNEIAIEYAKTYTIEDKTFKRKSQWTKVKNK